MDYEPMGSATAYSVRIGPYGLRTDGRGYYNSGGFEPCVKRF